MARRIILVLAIALLTAVAYAQSNNLLRWFGPATGILVGTVHSPQTRAATATDLAALSISGTPTTGHCAQFASATTFSDFGAACTSAPLSGTTGSLGGSSVGAGVCISGTITITGAATTMDAHATPATYPGDGFVWSAYVSSSNTVTVKICNFTSGSLTPTASTYNVRVLQ
jgi:hypothetical protein